MKTEQEMRSLLELIEWRLQFKEVPIEAQTLWLLGGMRESILYLLGEKDAARDAMIREWKEAAKAKKNQKNPIVKSS